MASSDSRASSAAPRDEDRADDLVADVLDGVGPSIASPDCGKHIAFLQEAFGAELLNVWPEKALEEKKPVIHATMFLNNGIFYIFDDSTFDSNTGTLPEATSSAISLTVQASSNKHAKELFEKAQALGATATTEMKKWFWQSHDDECFGGLRDAWGFRWCVSYERAASRAEFAETIRGQIKDAKARIAAKAEAAAAAAVAAAGGSA